MVKTRQMLIGFVMSKSSLIFENLILFAGDKELETDDVHSSAITSLRFDVAGKYVLTAGDRRVCEK